MDLNTGDILLFDDRSKGCFGCFTKLIKCVTKSRYSHIAMVLKDPTYINPKLKGLYVWESSWEGKPDPQDGLVKLGVQITPFEEIYNHYKEKNGYIFHRKLMARYGQITKEKILKIHDVVYSKPYDIILKDWIEELTGHDSKPQKTDRFWCSALIGYIYTKLGILSPDTDWSFLRASDFSEQYEKNLHFINDCSLVGEEQIL